MGPAFGFGVGAGSSLTLVLAGVAAFVLVSGFLSDRSDDSVFAATEKTSVIKLQVKCSFLGVNFEDVLFDCFDCFDCFL